MPSVVPSVYDGKRTGMITGSQAGGADISSYVQREARARPKGGGTKQGTVMRVQAAASAASMP